MKLEDILQSFNNIRLKYDKDGISIREDTKEDFAIVSENMDMLRDNFKSFMSLSSSIFYPDSFLKVVKLLPEGNKIIADNLLAILQKFVHKKNQARYQLIGIPEVSEKISENFPEIFNLAIFGDKNHQPHGMDASKSYASLCVESIESSFLIFIRMFGEAPNASEILEQNKDLILSSEFNSGMLEMVRVMSQFPNCHEFLQKNMPDIIRNCYVPDIASLYDSIRDIVPEEFKKEEFFVDNIYLPAMDAVLEKEKKQNIEEILIKEQIKETCSEIIHQGRTKDLETFIKFIQEVSGDETLSVCGSGAYSVAIQVADMVVKIRKDTPEEANKKIPYHPRILLPLLKSNMSNADEQYPISISVYPKIYTHESPEISGDEEERNSRGKTVITDEELAELYKDLREQGIRWLDIDLDNVGRLPHDNVQMEFGQNVPKPLEMLGFEDIGIPKRILKKGDVVILDVDHLYTRGEADHLPFIKASVPQTVINVEKEYMRKQKELDKSKKSPIMPTEH